MMDALAPEHSNRKEGGGVVGGEWVGKESRKCQSLLFSLSQLYLQKDTSSCISGEDRGKTIQSS